MNKKISPKIAFPIIIVLMLLVSLGTIFLCYFLMPKWSDNDFKIEFYKFNKKNDQPNDAVGYTMPGNQNCTLLFFKGESTIDDSLLMDIRGGVQCTFSINPSLPKYVFHLIADTETNVPKTIEVTKENEGASVQVLAINDETETPNRDSNLLDVEDINFDGYKDLKMLSWWGATGNEGYIYWLFDPASGKFVYNKDLSGNLSNPTPDPVKKVINDHSVGGMAGGIFNDATYKFDGKGNLIMIASVEQDWDEKNQYFVKKTSELKDGKMVVVKTEIIKEDF